MKITSVRDYANLARRTQQRFFKRHKLLDHATWGLTSEITEVIRAHCNRSESDLFEESGDVCWFIVELIDALALEPVTDHEYVRAIEKISLDFERMYVTHDKIVNAALINLQLMVGDIMSVLQKTLQGHDCDRGFIRLRLLTIPALLVMLNGGGDISKLYEIMSFNIDKLSKRYPNGFEANRSLNREQ